MSKTTLYRGLRVHYFTEVGFLNQDVTCDMESWFTDAEENWFFDAISGECDGMEESDIPEHFHMFLKLELSPYITWVPKEPKNRYTTTYAKGEPVR